MAAKVMTLVNGVMTAVSTIDAFQFGEAAAPSTPPANTVIIYAKADGKMYSKDDAGAEVELGGGGSSSPIPLLSAIWG
jgi:hypothetical protein